ncbi:MAG: prolyl oligopeptidase family serine peptidase [Gammaproteobacteria bacterium]|nr:prolyl oligopeptidase family serine peptidase [Gammaproteobacteria bacterium]
MSVGSALWPSPLDAGAVAGGAVQLAEPLVGDTACHWLQGLPGEGGRVTIMRVTRGGPPRALLPAPWSVRSRVNEYGGGGYTLEPGGKLWFVNGGDQALCRWNEGKVERIFHAADLALGDLCWDAVHQRLLAVAEARTDRPRQSLVAVGRDGRLQELAAGADFYAAPRPSADGSRLAWLEWSHPDMPWDTTLLQCAEVEASGALRHVRRIAGQTGESLAQPEWSPAGALFVVSDREHGFWNLYQVTEAGLRAVRRSETECARPAFQFAQRMVAFPPEGGVLLAEAAQGFWQLVELSGNAGPKARLPELSDMASLHAGPAGTAVLGAGPATPATLYFRPRGETGFRAVATSLDLALNPGFVARPQALQFATTGDETAYGLYFPPAHPDHHADAPPPVRVRCHGGPTSASSSALDPKTLYWTSRGFGTLLLNYRGSTGFGRAYREALYKRWGVADAEDARAAAAELIGRGLADPDRLTISGSSAGGLTVLNALRGKGPFAAGASFYGVADLTGLAEATHRFEAHYGEQLIGAWPADRDVYEARSPLNHAGAIACPMIFFQGLDDPVVPPTQSERMANALAQNGLAVVLERFEGESHGFRRQETIARTLEAELAFYAYVLHLQTDESLPSLTFMRPRPGFVD